MNPKLLALAYCTGYFGLLFLDSSAAPFLSILLPIVAIVAHRLGFNWRIEQFGRRSKWSFYAILLLGFLANAGMSWFPGNPQELWIKSLPLIWIIALVILLPAFVEELFFRQVLFRFAQKAEYSDRKIRFITASSFSAFHLGYLLLPGVTGPFTAGLLAVTFLLGLLLFQIRLETKSILPCMVAHAIYNFIVISRYL